MVNPTTSTEDGKSNGNGNSNSNTILPKKRHHNDNVILKNQNDTSTTTTAIATTTNVNESNSATDTAVSPPIIHTGGTTHVPSPPQPVQLQPITVDGIRPQKRFYRQRAHCNPLAHNDSYDYPITPSHMDWNSTSNLYPVVTDSHSEASGNHHHHHQHRFQQPTVLDIGCGFGGLTLALASLLPQQNICGIEIRAKVTEYVRLRILAARLDRSYCINPHAIEHSIPPPPTTTISTTVITTTAEATMTTSESTTIISLPAMPMPLWHCFHI